MKLNSELPKVIGWITRIVVYGLALVIIIPLLLIISAPKLFNITLNAENNATACTVDIIKRDGLNHSALKNAKAIGVCIEDKNGFLENMFMRSTLKAVRSLPNAPCEYVGIWSSSRLGPDYRILLFDNGEFTTEKSNKSHGRHFHNYSGTWGIHDNQMVWIYNNVLWPPDINIIESVGPKSFSLIESNRSHTKFYWIEGIKSGQCSQL